jgi:serine protease
MIVALILSACGLVGGIPGLTPPAPDGTGTVAGTVSIAPGTGSAAAAAADLPAVALRRTSGRPVYVPGQLLVKLRPGAVAAAASLHGQVGGTVVRTIDRLGVQVVRVSPGVSVASAMAAYRASGLVEYVEQDAYVYATATPNDPLYATQWHFPAINLPAAWGVTTGGAVIVAVLDTGIRADHPDLGGVTVPGYDFAAEPDDADPTDPGCDTDPAEPSHGTHVAGTVAARTNNATGVAGVNWGGVAGTRIMAIRVLNGCGEGLLSDVALGILHATDHGAKVINMSLGSKADSLTVDAAIAYARARGVTLVAAAGNNLANSCDPVAHPVAYPARHPQVIAVAATTTTNARASYSNCGPEIDVAAPGGSREAGVLSTTWSPRHRHIYAALQGTSMAAPHVAGVVALMISRGITGPEAIQAQLERTATDLGPGGKDPQFGAGLVNAAAAVGAGASAGRLRAFAGEISGTTITVQSGMAEVAPSGAFTITGALAGTRTIFAWQDFNGNGVVDMDDFFGRVDAVVITPGQTTSGVSITLQRYTGPPLLVTGAGTQGR